MRTTDTKDRILEAASRIMLEQSFHSVGLNRLLAEVGVPKGSFYHYFRSKEDLGVELIRHYAKTENGLRRKLLLESESEPNPVRRLLDHFTFVIGKFEASDCQCPCLMQKLGVEIANFSDSMREELARGFDDAIAIFRETLDEAVAGGFLPAELDTEAEARFIMDHWAGAQQRGTIGRSAVPLREAVAVFRQRLASAV